MYIWSRHELSLKLYYRKTEYCVKQCSALSKRALSMVEFGAVRQEHSWKLFFIHTMCICLRYKLAILLDLFSFYKLNVYCLWICECCGKIASLVHIACILLDLLLKLMVYYNLICNKKETSAVCMLNCRKDKHTWIKYSAYTFSTSICKICTRTNTICPRNDVCQISWMASTKNYGTLDGARMLSVNNTTLDKHFFFCDIQSFPKEVQVWTEILKWV